MITISVKTLNEINLAVRGTVAKGKTDETIYQKSPYGLIKYPGPKIPANPRTVAQQSNRNLFKLASNSAADLSEEEKDELREEIKTKKLNLNWRTLHISKYLIAHQE